MPRTLPGVNGRELPTRSADYRPPPADPSPISPFTTRPTPPDEPRRLAANYCWICCAMAVACAVAYGCTLDSGYLVIAVIATAGTLAAAAVAGE